MEDLRRQADALAADRAAFETEKAAFAANVQARSQQQAVSSTVRPDFRRLLIGPEDSYQVHPLQLAADTQHLCALLLAGASYGMGHFLA